MGYNICSLVSWPVHHTQCWLVLVQYPLHTMSNDSSHALFIQLYRVRCCHRQRPVWPSRPDTWIVSFRFLRKRSDTCLYSKQADCWSMYHVYLLNTTRQVYALYWYFFISRNNLLSSYTCWKSDTFINHTMYIYKIHSIARRVSTDFDIIVIFSEYFDIIFIT